MIIQNSGLQVLEIISLTFFWLCLVLGLWAIQPVVPGSPGSMRGRLTFMAWIPVWSSPCLVTPTSSVPPLPQNILQTEQIVGQRFCSWIDIPIATLEDRQLGLYSSHN